MLHHRPAGRVVWIARTDQLRVIVGDDGRVINAFQP